MIFFEFRLKDSELKGVDSIEAINKEGMALERCLTWLFGMDKDLYLLRR